MPTDIVVPVLGESVTEATIAKWLKQPGDGVAVDEPVVELETEKATVELGAPIAGVLAEVLAAEGRGRRGRRGDRKVKAEIRRRHPNAARDKPRAGGRHPRRPRPRGLRRGAIRRADSTRRYADPRGNRRRGPAASEGARSDVPAPPRRGASRSPSTGQGQAASAPRAAHVGAHRAAAAPHAGAADPPRAGARAAPADGAAREEVVTMTPAAPPHRRAPRRGAEHRRDPHDLQRGRHERGDRAARDGTRSRSRSGTACKLGFMSFFVQGAWSALRTFPR